jgi:hypothetical protein
LTLFLRGNRIQLPFLWVNFNNMASKILYTIKTITIGIRYARSFRIPDISGEMVDEILNGKNTPFDPSFFPNFSELEGEKILHNLETKNHLRITTDDLILKLAVNNINIDYEILEKKYLPFLTELLSKYNIKNISRLGIIFKHVLDHNNFLDEAIASFTGQKITKPNDVVISFSERLSSQSAHRDGVDDYKNTIYQFQKNQNKFLVDLDYQLYFKPVIEDARDVKMPIFLTGAKIFLVSNFYTWLNNYGTQEEQK